MFETDDWPDDWPEKNKKLYRIHDHFKYLDCGYTHRTIFQVDGFYRNPDEVRDYLLSCETTDEKDKCGGMIGRRVYETGSKAFEMQCNLKSTFNRLCKHKAWEKNLEYTGKGLYEQNEVDRVWEKMPVIANVTYGSDFAKREDNYNGKVEDKLEADDLLGILGSSDKDYIIWSIDKDLLTVPAHHLVHGKVVEVDEEQANYNFFYQTLVGDSTDNYKGCPTIGDKKATAILNKNGASWKTVVDAYAKQNLSEMVALENARLARILRDGEYNFKTKEVRLWAA